VKHRVGFVVESGTDVRMVEGLAGRFDLTVYARRILGGVEISHEPAAEFEKIVGPPSRLRFAAAERRMVQSDCESSHAFEKVEALVEKEIHGRRT